MKQRLFVFILLSLIVCNGTFAYDFSAVCESGQTLYYNITSNLEPYTVEVTSAYESHPSGNVIVPEAIVNNNITYSVTRIGNSAFFNCELTSIVIPNSVTSIGNDAFYGCSGLTSIAIPETVASIGNNAFLHCSGLTGTLTIPNSVTSIGDWAFGSCSNLTSIIIPTSVTSIGTYAFQDCTGWTGTLTIPNTITRIEQATFSGCSNLTSVTIPNSVISISSSVFSGCSMLASVIVGNGVREIESNAFLSCNNLTSVNYIGDISQWCQITFGNSDSNPISFSHNLYVNDNLLSELVIPETITEIKNYAFYGASNLTSVSIPHSVSSIGNYAFCGCYSLASIILQDSLVDIGNGAFMNCHGLIGPMEIPNSVEHIGNFAFKDCNELTFITMGNSVTSIGDNAFEGCSGLTEVTIPNSVTSIGNAAFKNCTGLTTVNFNATNCMFMGTASYPVFSGCTSLLTLNIGDNVTNIPSNAFRECSRLSGQLIIPNSVTNINGWAFINCSSLSSVVIGISVENIGSSAFAGCAGLISVIIPNSVTTIGNGAFAGCSGLTGELTIPNSVINIGNLAFKNCSGLTSIILPNSVTSIGYNAFENCSELTSITIPQSVTSIGDIAFDNCTGLTTVDFNATNCTCMGSKSKPVFRNCTSLSLLNIGENVTNIPDYAFKGCSELSNMLAIPDSVTSIGSYAFYGCSGLTDITIPGSVIRIGENAFTNTGWYNSHLSGILYLYTWCIGYKGNAPTGSLVIDNEINGVADLAFSSCSGLTSVIIPNSVIGIGKKAFQLCTRLNSVLIPSSVLYIGDSAFYMVPNIAYNGTASGSPWGALSANLYCDDGLFYTSMAKDTLVSALRTIVSADIPNTVVAILPNAFNGCDAITSLTIGPSVKNIGSYAFAGCSSLGYVNIPDSVEVIGEYAFSRCGLTAVNIGVSVKNIGGYAFSDCTRLSNVNVPDSVEIIGEYAFNACNSLTTLTIGKSVNRIGQYAFRNCQNLTTMNFNARSCSTMSRNTFTGCSSFSTLNIGKNVTRIPKNAFYNCDKLAGDLIIPDSVTNIDDDCFYGCPRLTSVTIGKSATYIGSCAFNNCSGLTEIYVKATTPPSMFSSYSFSNYSATLWAPCGSSETYSSAEGWNSFSDIRESRTYLLNVESSNLQKGTVKIAQHPNCDDGIAIISATPKGHFRFERWNDGNTDNPRTIVVESDTIFTATFAIAQYTITLVSIDETMGSVSESGIYDYGSEIQISATPAEHYHFVRWNDYITDNPRTITVTGDAIYTAYFTIDEHTVTVTENNSAMGVTWGSGNYDFGSEIDIAAYPRYGYAFLSWNDGNTETSRTIIVESDTTFTAIFTTARTVTIESSDNEMGYVIGSGEYAEGAEIEITAIPYEGYRFDHWVDVDNPSRDYNTDNPRTIVVSTDVTYLAVFTDVVGIEDNGVPAISVFPNPTSDILNITSSETISEIEIVNSLGQVVYCAEVNADNAVCDVNGLSNGVYLVRIQSKGAVVVQRRFVKE